MTSTDQELGTVCDKQPSSLRRVVRLRRWRRKPHSGGWWEWREGGDGRPERLLLCEGGTHVADDEAWQQATGKPAEDEERGINHNYWEGTETTQRMMPGLWMQCLPNVAVSEPEDAAKK